jgi:hypothetical protein
MRATLREIEALNEFDQSARQAIEALLEAMAPLRASLGGVATDETAAGVMALPRGGFTERLLDNIRIPDRRRFLSTSGAAHDSARSSPRTNSPPAAAPL